MRELYLHLRHDSLLYNIPVCLSRAVTNHKNKVSTVSYTLIQYHQHCSNFLYNPYITTWHKKTLPVKKYSLNIQVQRKVTFCPAQYRHYLMFPRYKGCKWEKAHVVQRDYLMFRNMRRAWLVFMAARAASSVEMRCRRVLGSVWRILEL